jgi:hypothetical protein
MLSGYRLQSEAAERVSPALDFSNGVQPVRLELCTPPFGLGHACNPAYRSTGMINQLVHIWKFKDDGDRRALAGVFEKKDFVEGVRFEVPTAGDEPGGEPMTEARRWGAASVRRRCQASSPKQTSCSRRV